MSREHAQEDAFQGPLQSDWTVMELLEWIGESDEGCHDARALVVLRAIDRALAPSAGSTAGAVMLVRSLVARVSADPTLGTRRLAEFVEEPPPAAVDRPRTLAAV